MRTERGPWQYELGRLCGFALALYALGCVVSHCVGCKELPPAVNPENADAVKQYEALLDGCKEAGKDAGSYAVYAACADDVDARLCRSTGVLCKDGGTR